CLEAQEYIAGSKTKTIEFIDFTLSSVVVVLYCLIFKKVLSAMTKVSTMSGAPGTSSVAQDAKDGVQIGALSLPPSRKGSQISTPVFKRKDSAQTIQRKNSQKLDRRDSNDEEPPVPLPSPAFTRRPSALITAISAIKPPKQTILNDSRIKAILFRAVLIAGGFIVMWTPPTTGRLMQYFNITIPDWLALWMTVSFSMMGIWNAFVFFLTSYWNEIVGVLGLKKSGESAMKESTNGGGTTGDASDRV
ncbi:hypothetical protein HDU79_002962, partial [Rhizoclosmatium sp. JEL0117]